MQHIRQPALTDEHVITLGIGLEEISRLNAWFDDLAQAIEIPEQVANGVKLCLNEAVTNTISYGFAEQPTGVVKVALSEGPGGLDVKIRDDGAAFNPVDYEVRALDQSVEEAQIGGLGVFLIREFASDVSYARIDGENLLQMRFLIDGAQGE